ARRARAHREGAREVDPGGHRRDRPARGPQGAGAPRGLTLRASTPSERPRGGYPAEQRAPRASARGAGTLRRSERGREAAWRRQPARLARRRGSSLVGGTARGLPFRPVHHPAPRQESIVSDWFDESDDAADARDDRPERGQSAGEGVRILG